MKRKSLFLNFSSISFQIEISIATINKDIKVLEVSPSILSGISVSYVLFDWNKIDPTLQCCILKPYKKPMTKRLFIVIE